ncbi:serine dehydrogenase [Propionibacterium acidifaciens]|uniref:serine dehydrogenase n=1 Tax=Propionibacterium acidifaciens TaxID=556499 RepID=UPI0023F38D21|nr:serine dehydrogenase [Propionibacterium acidifaciens]
MVRSVQLRCRGLTVVVPDMARSAATILCLGAHHILMGPGGDLGPIGPQMLFPGGDGKPAVASPAVASAKEVVAAVAEAEERIKVNPDSFPLFASLLSDATMLMVEQARAALSRSGALMQEASRAQGRSEEDVQSIGLQTLEEPLIDAPASHSAVISVDHAAGFVAFLLIGPTWAASGGD